MARLAEEVRNRRLNEYLAQSVTFGVFPLILGGLTFLTYQILDKQLPLIASLQPAFVWAMTALWITSGSAISLAAEFALRTYGSLSYDQLTNINPSRWQPRQGLYATVLTAFIAAFLLYLDIIQVGLGGVLLNDFDSIDKTYIALLIGGATGLGFTRVRDLIYSASQSIKIADPPQSQSKA
jgi:hypothetical protein